MCWIVDGLADASVKCRLLRIGLITRGICSALYTTIPTHCDGRLLGLKMRDLGILMESVNAVRVLISLDQVRNHDPEHTVITVKGQSPFASNQTRRARFLGCVGHRPIRNLGQLKRRIQ